ncbi:hypothetical protein WJX77_005745 [Trebouxia sp. C0004]
MKLPLFRLCIAMHLFKLQAASSLVIPRLRTPAHTGITGGVHHHPAWRVLADVTITCVTTDSEFDCCALSALDHGQGSHDWDVFGNHQQRGAKRRCRGEGDPERPPHEQ